jgi:hypothetical protein
MKEEENLIIAQQLWARLHQCEDLIAPLNLPAIIYS